MALPSQTWSSQQSFPGNLCISAHTSWPDCLLKLQSRAPDFPCHIACGSLSLRSQPEFQVRFEMVPSPIGSCFILELNPYPAPKTATKEQQQRNKTERMQAIFSTYDPEGERYADRRRYQYTSRDGNVAPAGPLSFSQQLKDVRYATGEAPQFRDVLWSDTPADKQMCFSWRSVRCQKFAFSRPLTGLPQSATRAAQTFRLIIEHLTSAEQPDILVSVKMVKVLPRVFWPWFAAIPAPVPESYWPWLHQPNVDPGEVMQFPPNKPFERSTQYVDFALTRRAKGWWNDSQSVNTLPDPLEISHLDKVYQFTDPRQYVAYVLGSHGYEELHSNASVGRWFNGKHTCDVFPHTGGNDRHRYMILLNIRQPRKEESAENAAVPDVGERVDINITLGGVKQTWTGRVVRIPSQYAIYGRNVAAVAEAPPYLSGLVLAHSVVAADFYFGHYGSPAGPLRESILGLMLGKSLTSGQTWLRNLLLGKDNHGIANDLVSPGLPSNFRDKVDAVCAKNSLNAEQIEAVRHFYTHKVTIVRGPPGTGKSTLVDTILELEEAFGMFVWVCTESNAAVDILAAKLCRRKGTMQPGAMLRLKPAFEETLTVERHGQDLTINALGAHPPADGQSDLAQAIDVFLRSSENVARAMSIEATIKSRMANLADIESGEMTPAYPKEALDLAALRTAYVNHYGVKSTDLTGDEFDKEEQKLEKKYLRKLRVVQIGYVTKARFVFSTAAAASGVLIKKFAPHALIMDEASQFLEARAVFPILQALSKGKLNRILLIGDDKQLPPTLMADRNPFKQTGVVSLFERLIKTGLRPVTMLEQYRMHPDISSVSDALIYHGLRNGPGTSTKDGVTKFREFMSHFATKSKVSFKACNAVVISPVKDSSLHWGSQKLKGSSSRINLLTARMVMRLVYHLVFRGKFVMSDILVIAYYKDQVALYEALFDSEGFKGIRVKTIDGSQGCEAPIVIVDCVVLGAAADEGMGFLGEDQRRFNVAMTRAQVGRITICPRGLLKVVKGKVAKSGAWNDFFDQANASGAVLDGHLLNEPTVQSTLESRFDNVRRTYEASVKTDQVNHTNVSSGKSEQNAAVTRSCTRKYGVVTFIEATGATGENALKFMNQANGDLAVAINAYFAEHGSDLPEEEI